MTLILTASDLAVLADMQATIAAVELAFGDITRGTAHQPAPTSLHLPGSDARFVPMTALADEQQLASVKLLADIPANRGAGLPTQRSTILLASQITGETLAILDGRVPTRVRTAAASAVASRHLGRPDSRVLGLVGAGALAVAHVEAMLAVLPIEEVVVWSRSTTTTDGFREKVLRHGLSVTVVGSPGEVFETADVVCTLTPATEPVVHGRWFRDGQHINAVGSRPRPDHREIDTEGMVRSRIFVDSRATAAEKSGDLLIPVAEGALSLADVQGELGEVVAGRIPGRISDADITLFNSVGIGMLDLAIGRLLYDGAIEQGLGLRVDLSR
ncbi:ornithine cyclodeaminase family protein [Paenarthrobacter sp. PH39-S1]|uniref:ornithine cyclodeaminase family protein n=1 Tax=Paenarthrobacter sp. PH39-S1 TaxID=3046204 RepID=UPI0024B8A457|nr:ornithine cyclodeaminase family protein [Paenarthrobacter sp. PH39-S1]MDJ0357860.1 ornithine cyclodeaminase family protein [Paenarthrobacter sp. PH39-S1]